MLRPYGPTVGLMDGQGNNVLLIPLPHSQLLYCFWVTLEITDFDTDSRKWKCSEVLSLHSVLQREGGRKVETDRGRETERKPLSESHFQEE